MTFTVKEINLTLQGEGYNTGRRAVFVRFTGCNIWSGREKDRDRDSAKGLCAAWCDTDFVGTNGNNGGRYSEHDLVEKIIELSNEIPCLVVFTGGEPTLQLTKDLCEALQRRCYQVCVETNGSRDLSPLQEAGVWITVSPKPPMPLHESVYSDCGVSELKLVVGDGALSIKDIPTYDEVNSGCRYLQPVDLGSDPLDQYHDIVSFLVAGKSIHEWIFSYQVHKDLEIP
jgi:organic radical activating enzyme